VGLWGLLGYGNLGNDGSLEAVLGYLREHHPEASLEFLCPDPERITARYGIPATRMHWNRDEYRTASGVAAMLRKLLGKFVDIVRTAAWVRRHDVVIVPGMGVLEVDDLPLRPWGTPYSLFLMCGSGRLLGTRVALVSVGADMIKLPLTRWLVTSAAGFAHYRSFRDRMSMDAMAAMGVDVSGSSVYPDLAFALPTPPDAPDGRRTVGVGVMSYRGGNNDRDRAEEIYQSYVGTLKRFVRWLVDQDHRVRLFIGDLGDQPVVEEILADLGETRPGSAPDRVSAEPMATLSDLMGQIATVDIVVATRYHNVLCALKAAKPTVSIGYAAKNDVLMAEMGLGEFCQAARSVDFDRLVEQFTALESRRETLTRTMAERNAANRRRLDEQFDRLSTAVFPAPADRSDQVVALPGER
jgi:polysaccharide pyruvyl transferase WcaK-like protein